MQPRLLPDEPEVEVVYVECIPYGHRCKIVRPLDQYEVHFRCPKCGSGGYVSWRRDI